MSGPVACVEYRVLQVLLEEFGKWIKPGTAADAAQRNQFYSAIYQQVLNVSMHDVP